MYGLKAMDSCKVFQCQHMMYTVHNRADLWCICVHDSSKAWPNADFYKMVAMHSISIRAFKGRAATWYVERAGAGAGKSEAHMFTVR